ncbi:MULTISPECIES: homoprotocatechuate degradation operon regulator HpaR [unclassified Ruegeria]|uniref:homoprotocatechuate degradation operon regulator HpaR n=1 Tax=unclassified Ruegeria TaxID=2625375 RepID=UPI0014893ABA|nr:MULTISPECIES: homoprotocatechuate degradation operon regulator HpaR [unclassified Ruegeria]
MAGKLPLTSRSLPIALLRAREKVMGPIRATLTDAGVTEQQWRVLRVLNEQGPMEPTQIAEQACLLLPSLTRILRKLEQKGLIDRHPDVQDRRRQKIQISRKGLNVIEANLTAILAQADRVREALGPDRHELLLDLLGDFNTLES